MGFFAMIFANPLARKIGLVLVGIGLILGYGRMKESEGADNENERQKDADNNQAADIRDRLDVVKPVPDDDLEFRD